MRAGPGDGARGYYSLGLFRTSLIAFAGGRLLSSVAGFALFLLLARSLPTVAYGQYLTLIATMELVLLYSSLGIPWIGIRYLPEFRMRASPQRLRRLLGALAALNALALAVALALLGPSASWWMHWLNLDDAPAALGPFLLICAFEGANRFATAVVLESLLAQRLAQLVQIVRNLAFLGPLAAAFASAQHLGLSEVLRIEAVAAALAAALACVAALILVRGIAPAAEDPDWPAPGRRAMAAIAWYNYSGNAVANLYSHPALQLLANALLGPQVSALFGFARALADQVRRYLPSEFLLSVIRPMLVASYTADGDHRQLNRRMLLGAKFSLVTSAPVLGVLIGAGPPAMQMLGGGRMQDAYWMVLALLFVSFSRSHRSLLGLYVNCVQQTDIWLRASLACLCVLPLAFGLVQLGWGPFALVAAMLAEELICTACVLWLLERRGLGYSIAIGGLARVAQATAASALASALAMGLGGARAVPLAALAGALAFGAWLLWRPPLDGTEQALLNRLAGRRLFRQADDHESSAAVH